MAHTRVTGLRGLEVAVYDLNESAEYYRKAWALEEVSRHGDRMHLRATGPEHHVLTLLERPKAGLVRVNFAADDKASVDSLHARALAGAANVVSVPHALPAFDGGGYGFEVKTPDGHTMLVSSNVDQHAVTSLDISRPWRINHVVLNSEDTQNEMRFLPRHARLQTFRHDRVHEFHPLFGQPPFDRDRQTWRPLPQSHGLRDA